ncbi:MAG: thiamine-binding protein [Clostridia bacterium]|nr:thiamine-binding protein [Clostridia bacterium]
MVEASVAIQVLPKVSETQEVIRIVDKVIEYIASTGLKYVVGPFETTIEGDYDSLMNIVKECNKICIREGAEGVSCYVKISYNPEGVLTIGEKTDKYN